MRDVVGTYGLYVGSSPAYIFMDSQSMFVPSVGELHSSKNSSTDRVAGVGGCLYGRLAKAYAYSYGSGEEANLWKDGMIVS